MTTQTAIPVEVPTADQITAGLTLEGCHPPFAEAQEAVAAAQARLREAKRQHTSAQAKVDELRGGSGGVAALSDALRDLEAARMVEEECERGLTEARERLKDENTKAARAQAEETARRVEQLQAVADEVAPMLRDLRAAWLALDKVPALGHGPPPPVNWPCSPGDRNKVGGIWKHQ